MEEIDIKKYISAAKIYARRSRGIPRTPGLCRSLTGGAKRKIHASGSAHPNRSVMKSCRGGGHDDTLRLGADAILLW